MANDTKGKPVPETAIPQHKRMAMGMPIPQGDTKGPKTPA